MQQVTSNVQCESGGGGGLCYLVLRDAWHEVCCGARDVKPPVGHRAAKAAPLVCGLSATFYAARG